MRDLTTTALRVGTRDSTSGRSSPKVPAADQTLRVLTLLARARGPLPASMIAAQLELPRSTVYQLLSELQVHGYVTHLPEERRYGLGIAAFELSSAYTRQEPLTRISRPLIASLVDRIGMSGHLAVPHGRDVLYIVEERAKGSPPLITDVNVRLPAQLTASGRAILAAMPKAQVRALFPDKESFVHRHERLPHAAEPEIDRCSRLRAVLDATTARQFSIELDTITPGFSSVAVPVLDHREWPVAAIAVTFRSGEVEEDQLATLAAEVAGASTTLSARIHGRAVRA